MKKLDKDVLYVLRTDKLHGKTEERVCKAAKKILEWKDTDTPLRIQREENGKPYFTGLPVFFSVTHSGEYWMCVFSNNPVGIDLQRKDTKNNGEKIARRFFHPEEVAFLEEHQWGAFFDVWAAKESYLKYTGRGIAGELGTFSVIDEGVWKKTIEGIPLQQSKEFPHYSLFICGGTGREIVTVTAEE